MAINEHEHKEGLIKPGNPDYLSYYNKLGEWKSTEAIGPIGAMSRSPGPAIVMLPPTIGDQDHDPRRFRAPAYKIGEKDDFVALSIGPGPAAYDVSKLTNKGRDECRAPIAGQKIEGYVKFRSPGPLAYHRGVSDRSVYRRSPAYTMSPNYKPLTLFSTPSPSSYTLPETLGPGRSPFKKNPAYRIGERLDKTGIYQPNPGPAAYKLPTTNVNKPRAPAFSMRSKDDMKKIGIMSPGPASNDYHLVKFHKPSTPRFSFGTRHTPNEAFQHFAAEK